MQCLFRKLWTLFSFWHFVEVSYNTMLVLMKYVGFVIWRGNVICCYHKKRKQNNVISRYNEKICHNDIKKIDGPGSEYCNFLRFKVWMAVAWEAYKASEASQTNSHVSGESPWVWAPFPKLTRVIKEEHTGNNLSFQRGAYDSKQWAGGSLSSELSTLIRPWICCIGGMSWQCSVSRTHAHTRAQQAGRAATHVLHPEDPSERASEAQMGSQKEILQRKHDQALMDAESPTTAHNSIKF